MEKPEPLHGAGGKAGHADAVDTRTELPSQKQAELSYDPESPPLGIHPKEFEAGSQRDMCAPTFTAALPGFSMEQSSLSSNDRLENSHM